MTLYEWRLFKIQGIKFLKREIALMIANRQT